MPLMITVAKSPALVASSILALTFLFGVTGRGVLYTFIPLKPSLFFLFFLLLFLLHGLLGEAFLLPGSAGVRRPRTGCMRG